MQYFYISVPIRTCLMSCFWLMFLCLSLEIQTGATPSVHFFSAVSRGRVVGGSSLSRDARLPNLHTLPPAPLGRSTDSHNPCVLGASQNLPFHKD